MRQCPNCGEERPLASTLYKCEECGAVYCMACTSNYGGGCPHCGSNHRKTV